MSRHKMGAVQNYFKRQELLEAKVLLDDEKNPAMRPENLDFLPSST